MALSSGKTHILRKDDEWTFCHNRGKGAHSTVYALEYDEVTDAKLSRPHVCKLCVRGFLRVSP